MNPIALIRAFVEHFHSDDSSVATHTGMARRYMLGWIEKRAPEEWKEYPDFAADVLIAAGFGRDEEQEQTVYCRMIP